MRSTYRDVSVRRDRRSLQNGRPARNFRLHQASETRGCSLLLGRNGSPQLGDALSDKGVINRLVQRSGKPSDDFFRCALRGENAGPNAHLKVNSALFCARDIGQRSQALVGGNNLAFHRARFDLLRYANRLFAQEIDMPAD